MGQFRDRLKAFAFLRFFQHLVIPFPFCQKMAMGCSMRRANLCVVCHSSSVPFDAAGQNDSLEPALGDAGQKVEVLLEKEFAYLLNRCYDFHKAFPFVFCGWSCFHYYTSGLCLSFRHSADLLIYR